MKNQVILALITKWVEERLDKFVQEEAPRIRGPKGRDGRDGVDFIYEEHQERIEKFLSLKSDEILSQLKEVIPTLKGEKGDKGDQGPGFSFDEHREEIVSIIASAVGAAREDFKLRFSDLSEEEIDKLKGPRGPRGQKGKGFSFEEHRQEIESILSQKVFDRFDLIKPDLKLKFKDLTSQEVELLKLKFNDLSPEDVDSLKLKFTHLTEDEIEKLRGPKGARGQRGKVGEKGDKGDQGDQGERGPRGEIGPRGPIGLQGLAGPEGRPGKDGEDAPKIERVDLQKEGSNVWLRFYFSNGDVLETNPVIIPSTAIGYVGVTGGGGGGADGLSAYEIAVENGFVGTEEEWLDSLVGPPGSDATIEFFEDGISLGTASEVNFTGAGVEVTKVGDRVNVAISGGGSGVEVIENIPCDSSVFVGSAVRMEYGVLTELNMDQWTLLALLPTLDLQNYTPLAVNALADDYSTSNVIGLVEAKPTSTTCNIRIAGVSAANYLGLDIYEEYYLSDVYPGTIVTLASAPTSSGSVLVKIGQPITPTQMLYSRGERVLRG